MTKKPLSPDLLRIDAQDEAARIENWVLDMVGKRFRKKGAVIGLSGGVDSSVCAAICVKALGAERIIGIFTPERECKEETNELGRLIADHLGITAIREDITELLKASGCYERRDDGIRMSVPEFQRGWGSKVVLPNILESDRLNISNIVVRDLDGNEIRQRMNTRSYLQVVAASNFKQRTRKMMEYYHADRLNYAVIGTPNKLEYDLGFFVKNGDGSADLKPIAHLYKTQVYQLGRHYGLPDIVLNRAPTTDTYSLPQSQEEFYFSLPYYHMDIALFAYHNGYTPLELSTYLSITPEQAERIYRDIESKRRMVQYLQSPPLILP